MTPSAAQAVCPWAQHCAGFRICVRGGGAAACPQVMLAKNQGKFGQAPLQGAPARPPVHMLVRRIAGPEALALVRRVRVSALCKCACRCILVVLPRVQWVPAHREALVPRAICPRCGSFRGRRVRWSASLASPPGVCRGGCCRRCATGVMWLRSLRHLSGCVSRPRVRN